VSATPLLPRAVVVVRVTPRATASAVGPWRDDVLHVRVRQAAVEGAANSATLKAVADALGVAPSAARLLSGARSRVKRIAVDGLDAEALAHRLAILPA